jgi:hypothetical protein
LAGLAARFNTVWREAVPAESMADGPSKALAPCIACSCRRGRDAHIAIIDFEAKLSVVIVRLALLVPVVVCRGLIIVAIASFSGVAVNGGKGVHGMRETCHTGGVCQLMGLDHQPVPRPPPRGEEPAHRYMGEGLAEE